MFGRINIEWRLELNRIRENDNFDTSERYRLG
jgi:hypothetical protein